MSGGQPIYYSYVTSWATVQGTVPVLSILRSFLHAAMAVLLYSGQVTNAFVLRRASRDWPAWIFCLSRFRGLPQDMAVPSRCSRRESLEKIQILKIVVSYDFSRINTTEQSRFQ